MKATDAITEFWQWFSARHIEYRFLSRTEPELAHQLKEDLLHELHKYCPELSLGFGGTREEANQLFITANGNRDYLTQVEQLLANAPNIDGWEFIAFKPPMERNFTTTLDTMKVNTKDLWFSPLARLDDPNFLGIKVFFKDFEKAPDKETLKQLLYEIVLLMAGEKAFTLHINYLAFEQLPVENENKRLEPLVNLIKFIQFHKSLAKKQTHLN